MLFSAITARVTLEAMAAVGLDAVRLAHESGIERESVSRVEGVIEGHKLERLWSLALSLGQREDLPAEVGHAVPFGAYGALDYLAGTASNVAEGFAALARHFRQVSTGFALEVTTDEKGCGSVSIHWPVLLPMRDVSDEFTLAVCLAHFQATAVRGFRPGVVHLTRPRPLGRTRHQEIFGAPVNYGCAVSGLVIPQAAWSLPLQRPDPVLQDTLEQLSSRLALGGPGEISGLVREALRRRLPTGNCTPLDVAQALGMSERSLQRRLLEAGTNFRRVLDDFRQSEAERLLVQGVAACEVAVQLGFSDQTVFSRAFRRWKGASPRAWLVSLRASASPPSRS